MSTVTLTHADCLDALRELPANSVDSVVTDPPYGLAALPAAAVTETLTAWASGDREFMPSGRGFMGKSWDAFVPPPAVWDEALRVLKPGGHLLAFAGSRTQDLMGLAIRLAGFEIRDSIAWIYGTGFPKSLDVSKAIDKTREDTTEIRAVCRWLRARIDEHPTETITTIAERFGVHRRMVEHWAANDTDSQPTVAKLEQWDTLREVLGFGDEMDAEVLRLNLRKGQPGEAWQARPVTGLVKEWGEDAANYRMTSRDGLARDTPVSEDARTWEGWGTALKPANEPIIMARKPLAGTVAANVLAHGTGALNIDANRIPGGRWPANVILDEGQAAELDALAPGASRFFYVAKAPKAERPNVDGVRHPTVKPLALMRHLVRLVTPAGGTVLEPFAGSGATVEAALLEGFNCLAIEREADYIPLIEARIERVQPAGLAA